MRNFIKNNEEVVIGISVCLGLGLLILLIVFAMPLIMYLYGKWAVYWTI